MVNSPTMGNIKAYLSGKARLFNKLKGIILAVFLIIGFFGIINEILSQGFQDTIKYFTPTGLIKFALAFYFLGWFLGAKDDTEIINISLALDQSKGEIKIDEITAIVAFFCAIFSLYYFSDNILLFPLILATVLAVNYYAYTKKIIPRVNNNAEQSKLYFIENNDFKGYFSLFSGMHYLKGPWQKRRFFILAILCFMQIISAIVLYLYNDGLIKIPTFQISKFNSGQIVQFSQAIFFFAYVVISETWMKIYRYKIFSDFVTIDIIFSNLQTHNLSWDNVPDIETAPFGDDIQFYNENYEPLSLAKFFSLFT